MQENEDDRNVKKQPIILLEQISTQKIKKQEEHLGKNETIPKECQPYIREAKENTNDAEDSVVFAKEIEQLDADDKEVNWKHLFSFLSRCRWRCVHRRD